MRIAELHTWSYEDDDGEGHAVTRHTTPEGAFRTLVAWVKVRWKADTMGLPLDYFKDDEVIVYTFFEAMEGRHSYDIRVGVVFGDPVSEEEAPEVFLDLNEITAVIYTLENFDVDKLSKDIGGHPKDWANVLTSVADKLR